LICELSGLDVEEEQSISIDSAIMIHVIKTRVNNCKILVALLIISRNNIMINAR